MLSHSMCTPRLAMFVGFNFVAPVMTWLTSPTHGMMMRYWAGVQQMQAQLADIAIFLVFVAVILWRHEYLLSCRWRVLIIVGTAVGCFGANLVEGLVAANVIRDQYFYLLSEFFLQIPRACNYLVCTVILAEMAPAGFEAFVYGIVSSAHSLAPLVARVISNPLYAFLPAISSDGQLPVGAFSIPDFYVKDTPMFRASVIVSIVVSAALLLSSFAFVGLIPKNAACAMPLPAELQRNQCRTRGLFAVLVIAVLVSTTTAVVFSVFAILPGSSCEIAMGGDGC